MEHPVNSYGVNTFLGKRKVFRLSLGISLRLSRVCSNLYVSLQNDLSMISTDYGRGLQLVAVSATQQAGAHQSINSLEILACLHYSVCFSLSLQAGSGRADLVPIKAGFYRLQSCVPLIRRQFLSVPPACLSDSLQAGPGPVGSMYYGRGL